MWEYLLGQSESGNGNVVIDSYYVDCVARGSKGQSVRELQEGLVALNAGPTIEKRYGVDGDFGSDTEKDVKAFQKRWGITADGVARKNTWKKLEDEQNTVLSYADRGIQYIVSSKACPGYNPSTKTVTPPGSPATAPEAPLALIKKSPPRWVIPVSLLAGVGLIVALIMGARRRKGRKK